MLGGVRVGRDPGDERALHPVDRGQAVQADGVGRCALGRVSIRPERCAGPCRSRARGGRGSLERHERHAVAAGVGTRVTCTTTIDRRAPGTDVRETGRRAQRLEARVVRAGAPRRDRAGARSAAGPRRRRASPRCARSRAGGRSSPRRCRRRRGRRRVWSSSTCEDPIGPFGETLTWPSASSGARADEEQRLPRDPLAQVVGDRVVRARHGRSSAAGS